METGHVDASAFGKSTGPKWHHSGYYIPERQNPAKLVERLGSLKFALRVLTRSQPLPLEETLAVSRSSSLLLLVIRSQSGLKRNAQNG